ncbi:hypothetical protein B7486_64860, partial [cyanobacterium TDX16]
AVLARLLPPGSVSSVLVYGVADGAEAVSLLATLAPTEHDPLVVRGRDLDDELLAAARTYRYEPEHAPDGLPAEADRVLEADGAGWVVRRSRRSALVYERGDVLEADADADGSHQLVCCQNTLTLFEPADVRVAVGALVDQVAPGGLLALGGGPLDHVAPAAIDVGLEPVLDEVEAIHEAWAVQRTFWEHPVRPAWALEPFDPAQAAGPARYATLFRRPAA